MQHFSIKIWSNLEITTTPFLDRFLQKRRGEPGRGGTFPLLHGAVPGAWCALGANHEELGQGVRGTVRVFLSENRWFFVFKSCKTWWCLDDMYTCVHSKNIFEKGSELWFIWNEGEKWKRTKFTYWRHNRKICSSKQPGSWQHALIKHLKPHRQQRTMSGHAASCQMERDTDLIRRTTVVFDRDFIISAGIR